LDHPVNHYQDKHEKFLADAAHFLRNGIGVYDVQPNYFPKISLISGNNWQIVFEAGCGNYSIRKFKPMCLSNQDCSISNSIGKLENLDGKYKIVHGFKGCGRQNNGVKFNAIDNRDGTFSL
jgi:hypothetical protein